MAPQGSQICGRNFPKRKKLAAECQILRVVTINSTRAMCVRVAVSCRYCIAFEVIFLFLVINVFSPRRPSVVGMATCITSRAQGSWQAVRGACLAFLHGVGRRSTLVFVISSSASDPDRPSSRRRCSCAAVVRRARPLDLS